MENEDSFPRPPAPSYGPGARALKGIAVPTGGTPAGTNLTSSSGSSTSLTLSPPSFLQQLHAAVKRQRPFGPMQSKIPRATRVLVSRGEDASKVGANPSVATDPKQKVTQPQRDLLGSSRPPNATPDQSTPKLGSSALDELMLTTSSMLKGTTDTHARSVGHLNDEANLLIDTEKPALAALSSQISNGLMGGSFKKGQLDLIGDNFPANQGANHQQIHQVHEIVGAEVDMDVKYDAPNMSRRAIDEARNHNHGEPMTRFSAIASSLTAISLHSGPTVQSSQTPQPSRYTSPVQMPESAVESSKGVLGHSQKEHAGATSVGDWNPHNQQVRNLGNGAMDKADPSIGRLHSEGLPANDQSTSARDVGASQPNKGEKERHKRTYDPNLFFKVNGKLYQKLSKIGSGGSSEVYKVITSDCIVYALKKIKLRGRDYPTAYGFCQEIEYLNKLKGKSNIIQMIDYEVTDKSLLLESSVPARDGRIKDDHYIFMVLEYGEVDLANMVASKWKERNNSNMKIDENWLRFYWQQMLEAVSTIHEERIVHSDLKPANFMLVRGSLKLIDFGIAKAIMNDTTNIQRDAQVGTLNYMSPEAFMCNDTDAGGNVIKCGRPSDIWSLGCILYQMVYGKTPFAHYKTFWAKYKEVTNRNHKIMYEPVDNPWLIDLMQRCLAWDRNERWRIPQLLKHPFLNPPVPKDVPPSNNDPCMLLVERIRVHWDNPVVQKLRSLIEELDGDH